MDVYRDISIFWCLINILLIFSLLYESRFSKKKTLYLNLVCMGGLIMLTMFLIMEMGVIWMGKYFLFTCTIPSFFYFLYMAKERNGRFFFTFCIADLAGFWIMALTNLIAYAFGENQLLLLLLRVFLFLILEYFTVKYFRKPYRAVLHFVRRGWGGFAFASGLFYAFFALTSGWPTRVTERPGELPAFILLLIIIPVVYFTIFILLYHQYLLDTQLQNEDILLSQLSGLQNQLLILNEAEEKNKILRHDFRHYMNQVTVFLRENNVSAACQILARFEEVCTESACLSYCNSPFLNSILMFYVGLAEKEQISVAVNFSADCALIPDEAEFSIMLANSFENAVNGCKKIDESGKREIRITMAGDHQLVYEIINTCREDQVFFDEDHLPVSDKPSHGIGTRSILAYAHKNGATVDYRVENGVFKLRILFPCSDILPPPSTIPGHPVKKRGNYSFPSQ